MHHRLAGTVILATTPALAADWVGGVGNWTDAANWAGGSVPLPTEFIRVVNGGTVRATDILFGGNGAAFGSMDFDGNIGDGSLVQSGGASTWTGPWFFFGTHIGATGHLMLEKQASLTAQLLLLGFNGNATADVSGGSVAEASQVRVAGWQRYAGRQFQSQATATIRGEGTILRITSTNDNGALSVGLDGSGSLNISDGAVVETTNALLVSTTNAGSSITIDHATLRFGGLGQGSWFDLGRDITLPDTHPPVGDAVLTLRNGLVEDDGNTRGMFLAPQSLVQGTGELRTSITNIQGSVIDPGENNTHGHLTVSRILDNNGNGPSSTGGTLRFDLTSTSLHDHLTVGTLLAGGTLEVILSDTFTAAYGDTFELITITDHSSFLTGDDVMGVFDTTILPDLAGPLFFEVAYSDTAVTLTVVPTPATLFALLALPLARRRHTPRP